MKYCPYCGAELIKKDAVFCTECGRHLSETAANSEPETEDIPDNYDGYYDDIVPADSGSVKQGVDTGMIKKIALLMAAVLFAIIACVAALYFV